jgi:hypothetical protein
VCVTTSRRKYWRSVLEQKIDITFCVKLGKIANDICATLSVVYEGEAMKTSSVSE